MPVALDRFYTRDEVLAFPEDGNRYELVHGELLVSPAPRLSHQRIVLELALVLSPFIKQHDLGQLCISPADISWGGRADLLVQPDLFVVAPHEDKVDDWIDMRRFHLFVEVLSPSTARHDRFTKRRLYQEMQVPLYWMIDIDQRRAEVWTPGATFPVFETDVLTWHPPGAPSPLHVPFAALFAP